MLYAIIWYFTLCVYAIPVRGVTRYMLYAIICYYKVFACCTYFTYILYAYMLLYFMRICYILYAYMLYAIILYAYMLFIPYAYMLFALLIDSFYSLEVVQLWDSFLSVTCDDR